MVTSFYLKYRPQKANDLDLTQVREFFERILQSGKVAHAYLFTGPRGTGKTSAARILAKIINCNHNSEVNGKSTKQFKEPCNKCVACKSVTDGSMVDLIEIDAASNRGIDDIRDLREKIGLTPVGAAKKVYIIDEVHMLTIEAFNALLKTLEEPPEHAVFVLATTESHKVPETIKSRCVRLQFPKATSDEVVRSLKKVVKGEKLSVSEGVLEEIASGVDGSFREGMKILEQLSLGKGKITLEKARSELGKMEGVGGDKFLEALADRDVAKAIVEIDRLDGLGVNWKVFLSEVLEGLRGLLLTSVGVEGVVSGDLDLKGSVVELNTRELQELMGVLLKAGAEMRWTEMVRLPLEMVAVEWCETNAKAKTFDPSTRLRPSKLSPRMESIRQAQDKSAKLPGEKLVGKAELPTSNKKLSNKKEQRAVVDLQHQAAVPVSTQQVVRDKRKTHSTTSVQAESSNKKSDVAQEEVDRCWSEVLTLVRPHNHSVEGLLRSTKPIGVSGNSLKIEVFYKFHLDQLNQEKFLQIVEGAVEKAFASKMRLEYFLGSRPKKKEIEEVENIAGGVEDEDIIQVAEEIFGAE